MVTAASIRKHPLHPMLVPLPIGLWLFSLLCDVAGVVTADPFWARCALISMQAGIAGALLAALPGFVDLYTMYRSPVKKIGVLHMSVNLGIVVLYVLNVLWRAHDPIGRESWQLGLSVAAVLLLTISGWLGGEMVYVHGVAVEPVDRHPL